MSIDTDGEIVAATDDTYSISSSLKWKRAFTWYCFILIIWYCYFNQMQQIWSCDYMVMYQTPHIKDGISVQTESMTIHSLEVVWMQLQDMTQRCLLQEVVLYEFVNNIGAHPFVFKHHIKTQVDKYSLTV